ncbi:MAG TPA: IS630 family transposase [Phycisphaerae bacterium]|nr:IS630 family transposase [Phycisphaerae bacterium]
MRPKGSAAELEQRRRLAISLLEQGMKPAHVAKAVGTSRASVTRWRQAWQDGGSEAVAAKPHPGKPPRLTVAQRRRLARLLLQGARKHGYSTDLWTLARVAEVIAVHFGVAYHPGHVWYVLRSMCWSNQKPERRARERDEQAIDQWRQQEWPRIKKSARKRP